MNVCFEFGALFHSAIRWGKQGGKFKINIHLNSVESFLFCFCSSRNQLVVWIFVVSMRDVALKINVIVLLSLRKISHVNHWLRLSFWFTCARFWIQRIFWFVKRKRCQYVIAVYTIQFHVIFPFLWHWSIIFPKESMSMSK